MATIFFGILPANICLTHLCHIMNNVKSVHWPWCEDDYIWYNDGGLHMVPAHQMHFHYSKCNHSAIKSHCTSNCVLCNGNWSHFGWHCWKRFRLLWWMLRTLFCPCVCRLSHSHTLLKPVDGMDWNSIWQGHTCGP